MSEIISAGALNTDYVIRGPRLPQPGETVTGGVFYRGLGGKAANAAIAAARAGARSVSLISAIGDDLVGEEAVNGLEDAGIASDYVRRIPGEKSGVALIMVDANGENSISVTPGAASGITADNIRQLPNKLFAEAKILLLNLELETGALLTLLSQANRHGLTTILDPAPYDSQLFSSEIIAAASIITPNQTEAAQITGLPTGTPAECLIAARKLRDMGCKTVALTMGSNGCLLLQGKAQLAPPRVVQAVDTTAAGDAFNGALACALAEGRTLHDGIRFASAAASVSVTRAGASLSLATKDEIEAAFQSTPSLKPF